MTFPLALAGTLAADQLSKALVRAWLPPGEFVKVLGEFLLLKQERNPGIAFSLFADGNNALIIALTSLLVALVAAYAFWARAGGRMAQAGLGMICGGALGNIIDRMACGKVIDFLDFRFWPVFNLADAAIVAGVALFVAAALRSVCGEKVEEGGGGYAP